MYENIYNIFMRNMYVENKGIECINCFFVFIVFENLLERKLKEGFYVVYKLVLFYKKRNNCVFII